MFNRIVCSQVLGNCKKGEEMAPNGCLSVGRRVGLVGVNIFIVFEQWPSIGSYGHASGSYTLRASRHRKQ